MGVAADYRTGEKPRGTDEIGRDSLFEHRMRGALDGYAPDRYSLIDTL